MLPHCQDLLCSSAFGITNKVIPTDIMVLHGAIYGLRKDVMVSTMYEITFHYGCRFIAICSAHASIFKGRGAKIMLYLASLGGASMVASYRKFSYFGSLELEMPF